MSYTGLCNHYEECSAYKFRFGVHCKCKCHTRKFKKLQKAFKKLNAEDLDTANLFSKQRTARLTKELEELTNRK